MPSELEKIYKKVKVGSIFSWKFFWGREFEGSGHCRGSNIVCRVSIIEGTSYSLVQKLLLQDV